MSAGFAQDERRGVLTRRVRLLVAATITYNLVEAVIALAAGSMASSAALIGFGLDSIIEVASAAAVAWQFSGADPQAREKVALRLISGSFVALALYISVESIRALAGATTPEHSPIGIGLAAVSLVVMPWLSWAQRRAGRELGSASAVADSRQTLLCTYLSAVVLVGLVLNVLFGWSWADPVAGLVIATIALKEARDAWRGDLCCAPAGPGAPAADEQAAGDCACCALAESATDDRSRVRPGPPAQRGRDSTRRAAPTTDRPWFLAVLAGDGLSGTRVRRPRVTAGRGSSDNFCDSLTRPRRALAARVERSGP